MRPDDAISDNSLIIDSLCLVFQNKAVVINTAFHQTAGQERRVKTVYTMIQKFLPIEMQVTYKVEGEPLEQLPDAYSEHYVQVGFWRDYTQGYDKKETFSHAYVNAAGEIYFVDCSIITAYGQIETFDNEHTVYTTVKIGDKEATLGTSEIPGQVTCYILIWEDAGVSCTIMGDGSLDELMKVAESIY